MPHKLPICCKPRAYTHFVRQIPCINSLDGLLQAAIAISMHELTHTDPQAVNDELQSYADVARSRAKSNHLDAKLAHLHDVLFEAAGFSLNSDDYYRPSNNYLPIVLHNKKGLQVTLGLIYILVAQRIGLKAFGIGLPGHFLAAVQSDKDVMIINPSDKGRLLKHNEVHAYLQQTTTTDVEWSEALLQPTCHRNILTRILQNLVNAFGTSRHYTDVAAMIEMEILLWPEQHHLKRDLGLLLDRSGMYCQALSLLDEYIAVVPDAPDITKIKQTSEALKRKVKAQ
jgi:regulator of sirC expression with transglutaminase-like and TPR domain